MKSYAIAEKFHGTWFVIESGFSEKDATYLHMADLQEWHPECTFTVGTCEIQFNEEESM